MNQEGTKELRDLLGSQMFDYPKPPVCLVKALVDLAPIESDDIVLDFFAGSATTAHAVLEARTTRMVGDRRFVVVQIPEACAADSPARQAGYSPIIADIGRERIRRVIERLQGDAAAPDVERAPQLALDLSGDDETAEPSAPQDLGLKVFRLAPSTFRRWTPPEGTDAAALERQLSFFDEGLKDDADPLHTLYEVLLKEGYSLNSEIEMLAVDGATVYRITDEAFAEGDLKGFLSQEATSQNEPKPLRSSADAPPSFYLCLDDAIVTEALDALPLDDETVFICQDAALDDSQKVNLSLQCVLKTI